MAKMSIGEFLSVLRKAKGMTQEEVAEQLGVSSKAVSSWENDRTCPDISLLPVIAELYGVTVDELVRGERNKTEEPDVHQQKISEESLKKIRKSKYASFIEKENIFTVVSLVSALVSAIGLVLFYGGLTWTLVFAVVGLLGYVTGIVFFKIYEKKYLNSEGIVLPEDINEENRCVVLTAKNRSLRSAVIATLPFIGPVVFFIVDYFRSRSDIFFSTSVAGLLFWVVGAVILLAAAVAALIYRIHLIRRYGEPEHKSKQKKNIKLAAVLAAVGAGLILLSYISSIVISIVFDGMITGYADETFDTFEDFRDYMQTLEYPIDYTNEKDETFTVPSAAISIPDTVYKKVGTDRYEFNIGTFDCGNSFYIVVQDDMKVVYSNCGGSNRSPYSEDGDYDYYAELVYRFNGTQYPVKDITRSLFTVTHPAADGSGDITEPVMNIRYADYMEYSGVADQENYVVKRIYNYYVTDDNPDDTTYSSYDQWMPEYRSSGQYAGKYGVFIYYYLSTGFDFVAGWVMAWIFVIYLITAAIIFAVKYKRQKISIDFDRRLTHEE